MGSPSDLAGVAVDWHTRRFPEAGMAEVALKLCEETGEVASDVNQAIGKNPKPGAPEGNVPAEAADVVICLLVLLGRWFPEADLWAEVEKKLETLTDPEGGHRASLAVVR